LGKDGGRLEWIDRRNDNNPSAAMEGAEPAASFFLSFSGAFSSASPAAFWMPPGLTGLREKTLANLFVFLLAASDVSPPLFTRFPFLPSPPTIGELSQEKAAGCHGINAQVKTHGNSRPIYSAAN
jgi:hypothetical protein